MGSLFPGSWWRLAKRQHASKQKLGPQNEAELCPPGQRGPAAAAARFPLQTNPARPRRSVVSCGRRASTAIPSAQRH